MKKFVVCLGILLVSVAFASAQCQSVPASSVPATILPTSFNAPVTTPAELTATDAELTFLATGPRLYPMREALALSAKTGKPVACWMGKHLFSDERARNLSTKLGDTTIQAAMDSDGQEGKIDPKTGKRIPVYRVKFSTSNYSPDAEVRYVSLDNMDKLGIDTKILSVARGGGR